MRLDKYLKLTRLIKRREVAKVLIEEGSIIVNAKKIKPSYEVKLNDEIQLTLGSRIIVIKVIRLDEIVNKKTSKELYLILSDSINR